MVERGRFNGQLKKKTELLFVSTKFHICKYVSYNSLDRNAESPAVERLAREHNKSIKLSKKDIN